MPETLGGQLAFCARIAGRVLARFREVEAGARVVHLLVAGAFHLIVVELPKGASGPGLGSWITAVGPLVSARAALREIKALTVAS
jgi:hypothetical protein